MKVSHGVVLGIVIGAGGYWLWMRYKASKTS